MSHARRPVFVLPGEVARFPITIHIVKAQLDVVDDAVHV